MPIINRIAEFQDEMTEWRRHIHAHPETAFEEYQTSDFVAAKLEDFGIRIDFSNRLKPLLIGIFSFSNIKYSRFGRWHFASFHMGIRSVIHIDAAHGIGIFHGNGDI